jgi:hypothetical protein
MRKLTKKEIENAPDWADKYAIIDEHVRWSNDEHFEWNTGSTAGVKAIHNGMFMAKPKPIPR